MLDGTDNLDLKTHIYKPKQLASLNICSDFVKGLEWSVSSDLIKKFIEIYLRYMVSYRRLSRTEIIQALSHVIEVEEKSKALTDLT